MTTIIVHSDLTGKWYVVTRWKQQPDENGRGIAARKYDVTDQMEAIINQALEQMTRSNERVKVLEAALAKALDEWDKDSSALAFVHLTHPHLGYEASAEIQEQYRECKALLEQAEK